MASIKVFVSYSKHDASFGRALVQGLRSAGADVWFAEDRLREGRLMPTIEREIRDRSVFIVLLSPDAFASHWVNREARWAYDMYEPIEHKRDSTRYILPITAAPIEPDAFTKQGELTWLFLKDFKRIEYFNHKPYPLDDALRLTLETLNSISEFIERDKGSWSPVHYQEAETDKRHAQPYKDVDRTLISNGNHTSIDKSNNNIKAVPNHVPSQVGATVAEGPKYSLADTSSRFNSQINAVPVTQLVKDHPGSFVSNPGPPLQSGRGARLVAPTLAKAAVKKQGRQVAAIVLVLLLVSGSAFLYFFINPSSDRVSGNLPMETLTQHSPTTSTIITPTRAVTSTRVTTPASLSMQNTPVVVVGPGESPSTQPQSGARVLSVTMPPQSLTVNATGHGTTPATFASGKFQITNTSPDSAKVLSWSTGTTIFPTSVGTGIPAMVLDQPVNLPPPPSNVVVQAHANTAGPQGNLAANVLFAHCHAEETNRGLCYTVTTATNFTGGANAQAYSYVQQSDIDTAAKSLETPAPDPQQVLRVQLAANEHLIGTPSCSPQVSSDHAANDRASTVKVTVVFICNGQAQS